MRNANIPSLLGSPKRSATCDPGGAKGLGFHFTSWLEITLCPAAVLCGSAGSTDDERKSAD